MKPSSAILLAGLAAFAFATPGFAAEADKGTETVLHGFDPQKGDGIQPVPGMVDLGGTLYGTTSGGGAGGYGTAYAINPTTGAETVIHSFCAPENCGDGFPPNALIGVNGVLYGTTGYGGIAEKKSGTGTVFALDPGTGSETVLYTFSHYCSKQRCPQGGRPMAGLAYGNNTLYGTTPIGGSSPLGGLIFSVDPGSGAEQTLYSFCSQQNCTDGQGPQSMIYVGGILYGTTSYGGTGNTCAESQNACGTVYSFDPSTGTEKALYSFCSEQNCTDGGSPGSGLVDVNGTLYGTTFSGGAYGGGTVFAIDAATGAETVIHSFKGNGDYPPSAPLTYWKGKLYGTTPNGGTNGQGTLIEMNRVSGKTALLHTFGNVDDGYQPNGDLTAMGDFLYGTTVKGHRTCTRFNRGILNCGTVFSWTP